MLGLAKRVGAKILQASTSEVYGDPAVHPQTEDYWGNVNPIGPRACYDEGKRCAETLFFDYHRQHGSRIKVARIFNTYGPRMHPNDGRVVSNFIVQALRGEDITIYGDGSQTRSFCYVDDLIEGFVRLMATGDDFTGPVNLGNPHEIPVSELADRVIRLTGSRSRIVYRALPQDDPMQRCPDITLARSTLGLGTARGAGRRPDPHDRLFRSDAGGARREAEGGRQARSDVSWQDHSRTARISLGSRATDRPDVATHAARKHASCRAGCSRVAVAMSAASASRYSISGPGSPRLALYRASPAMKSYTGAASVEMLIDA